jgi:hypothetical protein
MAGAPKSSGPPDRRRQVIHLFPCNGRDRHDQKLRDPITGFETNRFRTMVDQDDLDLPPVAGIDHPGPVDDAYARPSGVPAPGYHETGVPFGDCNGETGGHTYSLTGGDLESFPGGQIEAGITWVGSNR